MVPLGLDTADSGPDLDPALVVPGPYRRLADHQPIFTPPPADDSDWATRAVLGEELWLTDRPIDRLAAINGANTAVLIATILSARKRNKPLTIVGAATSMALTLVSWNLYANYYDQHRVSDL